MSEQRAVYQLEEDGGEDTEPIAMVVKIEQSKTEHPIGKQENMQLNEESAAYLKRAREELERTIDLQHQIERGKITPTLKNYWLVSSREKNVLRYGTNEQEWQGESVY